MDKPTSTDTPSFQVTGDNSVDFAHLHPLENAWSIWYDKRQVFGRRVRGEQGQFENNLVQIGSFATVEEFWRYKNHLVKPSAMEFNANQHMFKEGVKPMWEDPINVKGGKWIVVLKNDGTSLDKLWEDVLLALIGECMEFSEDICGCVVSRRKKGDKISIWNADRNNEKSIMAIGRCLKELMGTGKFSISYQNHEDSIRTGASYTNPVQYKM